MLLTLAHRLRRRRGVRSQALAPGSYLTDGRRLFRVLSWLAAGGESALVLEDCATLDARVFARTELDAMRLRAVRPAAGAGARAGGALETDRSDEHALAFAQAGRG